MSWRQSIQFNRTPLQLANVGRVGIEVERPSSYIKKVIHPVTETKC